MSEVKFKACDLRASAIVVQEHDFDRITAERDAALAELGRYQSLFNQAQKAIDRLNELHRKRMAEIGRRLTAADERADVLEGLLTNAYETAAKWVEKRCDAYVEEHGSSDPETGTVEFPGDGEEYVGELMEIADGLRALKPVNGDCRHGYANILECPECGASYQ